MKLSNNFSLKEMTASQTADRHGISNNPSEDHMDNLKKLCENILQPIRDHYGKVVSVSSGYRSPELCVKIGSSLKSQHAKGQAADFEIFGLANAELAKYIIEKLNFDQLILEFHNPEEPNSGWIHWSQLKKINSIIPLEDKILFKKPSYFSKPLAKIKKGRVLIVQKCDGAWCKIKSENFNGWVKTDNIWGSVN